MMPVNLSACLFMDEFQQIQKQEMRLYGLEQYDIND